ncbi:RDD family protein [Acinetobacter sp. YH12239]|uniref:RDD family protein n=1 Tax=Acinetobacter sp. YH12239 TaxID=2601166 RepID=UPI0015D21ACC|nr:RDD family protein [Acinetobacter sp. YH12239]
MQIYLARNNQQAGPYTVEQLNQMLSSQQVLLTDLVWHQGMTEWKALGELTQGKLYYQPEGYHPTPPVQQSYSNPSISSVNVQKNTTQQELASIGSRFLAKLVDLALWLPAMVIPSFFMQEEQVAQLTELQQKMQNASSSDQAIKLQEQLFTLIPMEAWQAMLVYIVVMLAAQAFLIAKSGQSLGKKVAKIQIVDAENGQQVNLMRAFTLRSVIFIVLNLLFMPFITIIDHAFGLSQKRQTLHDKLAKTKVVKR